MRAILASLGKPGGGEEGESGRAADVQAAGPGGDISAYLAFERAVVVNAHRHLGVAEKSAAET